METRSTRNAHRSPDIERAESLSLYLSSPFLKQAFIGGKKITLNEKSIICQNPHLPLYTPYQLRLRTFSILCYRSRSDQTPRNYRTHNRQCRAEEQNQMETR